MSAERFLVWLSENRAVLHAYRLLLGWVPMHRFPLSRGPYVVHAPTVDRWLAARRFDPGAVRAAYAPHVRPGDTIADVGANLGLHALVLADLAGPSGRVLAFEPHPGNFDALRTNLTANGFQDRAVPVNAALSDRAGERALFVSMGNGGDHRLADHRGSGGTIPIACARLDDRPETFHALKIDVQGHELAVLRGAAAKLRDCRAVWIEIYPDALAAEGTRAEEVVALLGAAGLAPEDPRALESREPYFDVLFVRRT